MSSDPLTLEAGESVRLAARRMWANDVGSVLVTDGDELAGIVTERDLSWMVAEGRDPEGTVLSDVMSSPVEWIEPAADLEAAVETMADAGVRRLAVILEGELRGVVNVTDIAYADPEQAQTFQERRRRPRWQD